MSNKMISGVLVTIIGLVFSAFSFIYAVLNPWNYNGIDGVLGGVSWHTHAASIYCWNYCLDCRINSVL